MFEALPASVTAAAPSRARAITFAVFLHALLIGVAVSSTASSGMSAPQVARDTIRVDLAVVERQPSDAQPGAPAPALPSAPAAPDGPMTAPSVELPQLDFHGSVPAASLVAESSSASPGTWSAGILDSAPSFVGLSEVDELPRLLTDLRPEYPRVLRRAGVSGAVEVEYVVGKDGRVDLASLRVRVTDHDRFTESVVRALRVARFSPARRAGRPVAVLVRQTIRFRSETP
jgi:periplasmic protein TonB